MSLKTLEFEQILDPRITVFKNIDEYLLFCLNRNIKPINKTIKPSIDYLAQPKMWVGPAGVYDFINPKTGAIHSITYDNQESNTVNILGKPNLQSIQDFQSKLPASDAEFSIFPGAIYSIGSERALSLLLEPIVKQLCDEIIMDGFKVSYGLTVAYGVTWKSDPRRFYTVKVNDLTFDAGYLFAIRHQYGINCPGVWTWGDKGPTFIPFNFKDGNNGNIWDCPFKLPIGYEFVVQASLTGNQTIIREVSNNTEENLSDHEMIKYLYTTFKKHELSTK